jgi:hypothetical protein
LAVVVATCLAAGAVAAALAGSAGLSVFLALITLPVALYAALAAPRGGLPIALAAALTGVGVMIFWGYTIVSAISGS